MTLEEPTFEPDEATLRAPFPYFGGKSGIASLVWSAFGPRIKHYIEPFMGSLAVLLAAPYKPRLEVVNDKSFYLANFWRAVRYQPDEVARWADYPVSHIDLAARHRWLTRPDRLRAAAERLADPEWPGDPQCAGWWLWGQCAWIGSGWCEKEIKIPHISNAGQGVHSKIPHISDAGHGVHSKIPHISDAGQGVHSKIPHIGDAGRGAKSPTSAMPVEWDQIDLPDRGEYILRRMRALTRRLQDVRIIHGDWERCLNSHYGGKKGGTGVFLDPPYINYERLYAHSKPVALDAAEWAARNRDMCIAVCGHAGDYDQILRAEDGWRTVRWSRGRFTYNGSKTTGAEAVYFSPACEAVLEVAK